MSAQLRWVFFAGLAHVLADDMVDTGSFRTLCAREVSVTTSVYRIAPSLDVCRICRRVCGIEVPPDEFPATLTVF